MEQRRTRWGEEWTGTGKNPTRVKDCQFQGKKCRFQGEIHVKITLSIRANLRGLFFPLQNAFAYAYTPIQICIGDKVFLTRLKNKCYRNYQSKSGELKKNANGAGQKNAGTRS